MPAANQPIISIVTPAYNESGNIRALYARLVAVLDAQGLAWEWIVVDDSSSDATFEIVREIAQRDPRVRGVRFARNFGSHMAMLCGIRFACGECVTILAGDLQDPPEAIPQLVAKWREGARVVWAVRGGRPGEKTRTVLFSRVYWWIMRRVVGMKRLPPGGADFFLLDRVVMDALNGYKEGNVQIMALIAWMGFKEASIVYDKQSRVTGSSGWSMEKKLKLVADSVISFSYMPVRLMSYCGFVTAMIGFGFAMYIVLGALINNRAVSGWPSLMTGVTVFGGMQMLMMGVLGEYIWRALDESRGRPRYIIEGDTSAHPKVNV